MQSGGNKWLASVSDMMSGLMLLFLFIAVVYMLNANEEKKKAEESEKKEKNRSKIIKEITATYQNLQLTLYNDLMNEFKNDLTKWKATIEKDSTIRFNEPEILFSTGKSDIKPLFREILNNFFPRYLKVLISSKYINEIDEVRVEGHTSSKWTDETSQNDRYLNNAQLSQSRAFSVLEHCFLLASDHKEKVFLIEKLRANGLSYAKPILDKIGNEDFKRSRRVEFRTITKTKEQILKVIEILKNENTSINQ